MPLSLLYCFTEVEDKPFRGGVDEDVAQLPIGAVSDEEWALATHHLSRPEMF
ncbi:MAG: hypothetical protein JKP90_04370 [Desulfofustis sp. PB-SRB1]|jgi:hypothetical protein|nr:hypothetical protein [Desulfofustis sp. PB-SRB1]